MADTHADIAVSGNKPAQNGVVKCRAVDHVPKEGNAPPMFSEPDISCFAFVTRREYLRSGSLFGTDCSLRI